MNGDVSSAFPLKQRGPQGRCLGLILFSVYTSELFDTVEKHLPSVHCYADDSQLCVAFSPNVPGGDEITLNAIERLHLRSKGLDEQESIKAGHDKTEF